MINIQLFKAINNLAGHQLILDKLMILLTNQSPVLCGLTWLAMLLYTFKKKFVSKRNILLLSAAVTVFALLINYGISHWYYSPRPFASTQISHVKILIVHKVDSSFPSKHTTGSWTLAFTSLGVSKRLSIWLFSLASIIGFSRIYVGVHWPIDILGGVLLASLVTIFSLFIKNRIGIQS